LDNFAKEELKDWNKKTPEEKRQRLEKMRKHYELIRENVEVGILLASKAVVQVHFHIKVTVLWISSNFDGFPSINQKSSIILSEVPPQKRELLYC